MESSVGNKPLRTQDTATRGAKELSELCSLAGIQSDAKLGELLTQVTREFEKTFRQCCLDGGILIVEQLHQVGEVCERLHGVDR